MSPMAMSRMGSTVNHETHEKSVQLCYSNASNCISALGIRHLDFFGPWWGNGGAFVILPRHAFPVGSPPVPLDFMRAVPKMTGIGRKLVGPFGAEDSVGTSSRESRRSTH